MTETALSSPEDIAAMTERAREVIRLNIEALDALERSIDVSLARAADVIMSRPGYVVVTGMGKSGHIGGKIAATLASTGTNAFFVHPAEMSHGDLGMLRPDVTVLALSNSGESRELRDPLIYCQRNGIPVIAVTQRPTSFLGRNAAVCLTMPKVAEACPNGLAPTTSTLMSLALGDALAMVLMDRRGFTALDFGLHHPGGALGMSLQSVREWMGDNAAAPAAVPTTASFSEVVSAVTEGRKGAVAVLNPDGTLGGIVTDGDIRRAFQRDIAALKAADIMSPNPITVDPDARMSDVVDLLTANKISNLFVVEEGRPTAIVHIAELMQAGYVSLTMRVLYDVSRLLSRAERTAPTGVDRVCLAYAEWLDQRSDVVMIPVRGRKGRLVTVDQTWFRDFVRSLRARWDGRTVNGAARHEARLLAALTHDQRPAESVICPPPLADHKPARDKPRVLRQFFRSRHAAPLPAADLYLNVGHTTLHEADALQALEQDGVDRVVMIHDLIPITHPEFCRPGDADKHRARVVHTLRHASSILVNSRHTADQLAAFAAREGLTPPPVHVAHLGIETAFAPGDAVRASRPYFIHVGTIEARKNLAQLLTLWRRLEEEMGERTPSLVLVGRYGWENEAVLDHLQRSPNLQGVVHQAENLSDGALVRLMRGARAVLAPSAVEGFDLPAVEACAMGAPLIASDIPPHRELTPQARLIDPLDGLGWLDAIRRATLDEASKPAAAFAPPRWDDHFAVVAGAVGLGGSSPLAAHGEGE